MTAADRARAYRARKAAEAGREPGRPGRPVEQPCGTVSAYKRHQRRGEEPCGSCRAAWADWQRIYQQQRKNR